VKVVSKIVEFSFTTKPKTRRHIRGFISGARAKAFMYELFKKGLRKCSYETLKYEFVNFFQTCDDRTIRKYIGRPEQTVSSGGSTKIFRVNRMSGKTAQFEYFNTRKIPAEKGLLDVLGWILKLKDGTILINHECMPYFTKQVTLNEASPPASPHSRIYDESLESSKDNLRARPLYDSPVYKEINKDIEVEKKKKEEVIGGTHTNLQHCNYALKHTSYALWEKEVEEFLEQLKNAKLVDSEPDRAKIKWNSEKKDS